MTTILGMAKGNLDLKGAKSPKLELDFLRLVYASKKLDRGAFCYLAVMTQAIANRVNQWASKYDADGVVDVVVVPLPKEQLAALWQEKFRNAAAMKDLDASQGADASLARDIGEAYLKKAIMDRHPGVEASAPDEYPLMVRWDFCGRLA